MRGRDGEFESLRSLAACVADSRPLFARSLVIQPPRRLKLNWSTAFESQNPRHTCPHAVEFPIRPDAELGLIMAPQQRGVDALVLVGTEHSPLMWSALRDWDKPALLTWVCDARLPSIGIDNEAAGYAAAQHLLDLGHKRIGVIAGITLHNDRARLRINGVRLGLAQAGLKLLPALLTEQAFKFEGGSAGLRALMASRWPPPAIFCGNDLLAAVALLEAARMGLKVPQQLSSCGFDDKALAGALNPA